MLHHQNHDFYNFPLTCKVDFILPTLLCSGEMVSYLRYRADILAKLNKVLWLQFIHRLTILQGDSAQHRSWKDEGKTSNKAVLKIPYVQTPSKILVHLHCY